MVEAALIVPIVLIAVIVVLYIMLIIFQTSLMQTTANNIAERAAASYYNNHASITTGRTSKENIGSMGLYRRWGLNPSFDQNNFKIAALKTLQQRSILKGHNSLDIKKSGNVINQRVTVLLSCTYDNPLGAWTTLWGLNNTISLRVRAEATIDDPAEFIRNSDFILETASRVPIINDFESKWQGIINKIVDYVNKLSKEQVITDV